MLGTVIFKAKPRHSSANFLLFDITYKRILRRLHDYPLYPTAGQRFHLYRGGKGTATLPHCGLEDCTYRR